MIRNAFNLIKINLIFLSIFFLYTSCNSGNNKELVNKKFIESISCKKEVKCDLEILKKEKVKGSYFPDNKCFENTKENEEYVLYIIEHKDYPLGSPLRTEFIILNGSQDVVVRGLGDPKNNDCNMNLGEKGFGNNN